ncbi:MAG: hypothetical protein Q8O68_00105 [Candidatus Daviesbacteria bacterium]|nr:hypothetical protein [Candidatus Daviesbacteria bacterium]
MSVESKTNRIQRDEEGLSLGWVVSTAFVHLWGGAAALRDFSETVLVESRMFCSGIRGKFDEFQRRRMPGSTQEGNYGSKH